MKIFFNKLELTNALKEQKNLGFVPTMGSLHKGHLYLIKKSFSLCSKTIVTIFVNKPQFNRASDYKNYPRKINRDISILKKLNVDFLYIPTSKQIYPCGINKNIKISKFSKKLCGKSRPGHFSAVVDVIDRFIKIIKPSKIFLGEKDMQQLLIVKSFFKKNKIKTKLINCKTIREKNGMPYSSRNNLLSIKNKKIASKVYNLILKNKKNLILKKSFSSFIKEKIFDLGVKKIDYFEILDINKLSLPFKKQKKIKIFIAFYLGSTRLIDNI